MSEAPVVRPVCVLSLAEIRIGPQRTLTPDQWWQTAGRRAVCPVCVVRYKVVQGRIAQILQYCPSKFLQYCLVLEVKIPPIMPSIGNR